MAEPIPFRRCSPRSPIRPSRNSSAGEGAVTSLGADAIKPLSAAVGDSDPARAIVAIRLLAAIGQKEAAIYLLAPALAADSSPQIRRAASEAIEQLFGTTASRADAITLLTHEARSYLDGQKILRPDDGDNVAIWNWDTVSRRFMVASYPPSRAATFVALRLASDLFRLEPSSFEARAALSRQPVGFGHVSRRPRHAAADRPRHRVFNRYKIRRRCHQRRARSSVGHRPHRRRAGCGPSAARHRQRIAADSRRPKNSPLAKACRSDDRRLRRAAAEAILSFKPAAPFAGSSYVTDAVADLATSTGHRRAVIGFPNDADRAATRRPCRRQRIRARDCQRQRRRFRRRHAIGRHGIHSHQRSTRPARCLRPGSTTSRRPRTAQLPIGVMGELEDLQLQMKRFAPEPNVFVVFRPEKPAEMTAAVAKSVQLSGDHIIPPMLRLQEAAIALDWLAEMAAAPPEVFDVRRYESVVEHALYHPLTAAHAAAVMARLGTHSSQVALLDLASLPVQPLDVRQAAMVAFAQSVQHFGLRLAPSEVIRQYDRYNQSAQLDKATQQLLGRLLDTIEAPTKQATNPKR